MLAIEQLKSIKKGYAGKVNPILLSGQIGSAGDGYALENIMTPVEAKHYHGNQWETAQWREPKTSH